MKNNPLYVIGDLHISDKEYHIYGMNKLMEWIRNTIPERSSLLFLGDILTSISANIVAVQQLVALIHLLRDMDIDVYILIGNHDYGMLNRQSKCADEFYKGLGCTVISDFGEVEIEGINCLMLPWKRVSEKEATKQINEKFAAKKYDVVFGHWNCVSSPYIPNIDISKVQATYKSFGHVHIRTEGCPFIGAPVPNASNEFPTNAVYQKFEKKEDGSVVCSEKPLPEFIHLNHIVVAPGKADKVESMLTKGDGNYYMLHVSTINDYSILKQIKLSIPSILGIKLNTSDEEDTDTKSLIGIDKLFSIVTSLPKLYQLLYEEKIITEEEMTCLNKYCI